MSVPKPSSLRSLILLLPPVVGVILLLPRLAQFVGVGVGFVAWPWQFDFTEGVVLDAVNLAAHGTNIYGHFGPDGFVSAPYTPLYFLVNGLTTRLGGLSFGPGRAMSLGATVLIAVAIGYIVWLAGRRWAVSDGKQGESVVGPVSVAARLILPACAVFAGALWLSLSPVIVWAALYEPNMPALLFEVAGVAWTLAFWKDGRVYWGIVFLLLAFYTK